MHTAHDQQWHTRTQAQLAVALELVTIKHNVTYKITTTHCKLYAIGQLHVPEEHANPLVNWHYALEKDPQGKL